MITVEDVIYVRVELPHPVLLRFQRAMIDAEVYSRRGSGSHWKSGQAGVPLEDEVWVTYGEFDPSDREAIERIHAEVTA